ncbi:MAG: GNAT family N-acetyltransferase [Chloroflexi bacterium]|nr:MAG: GNAT family N-acetyltransferase [Chloroflexota bacterium]
MFFESGQIIEDAPWWPTTAGSSPALTMTAKRQPLDGSTWITGVGREYRGRGIGTAIKVEALSRAKARGLRALVTTNDEPNKAMREINATLGYQPLPARVQLEKPLLH